MGSSRLFTPAAKHLKADEKWHSPFLSLLKFSARQKQGPSSSPPHAPQKSDHPINTLQSPAGRRPHTKLSFVTSSQVYLSVSAGYLTAKSKAPLLGLRAERHGHTDSNSPLCMSHMPQTNTVNMLYCVEAIAAQELTQAAPADH